MRFRISSGDCTLDLLDVRASLASRLPSRRRLLIVAVVPSRANDDPDPDDAKADEDSDDNEPD